MRFKVDENLPIEVATALSAAGHDAHTVHDEQLAGRPDRDVAAACLREQRALVTLDQGFADIRAYPPRDYPGIVVLRPICQDKAAVMTCVAKWIRLLGLHPIQGHLWIVEKERVRLKGPD